MNEITITVRIDAKVCARLDAVRDAITARADGTRASRQTVARGILEGSYTLTEIERRYGIGVSRELDENQR